MLSNERNVNMYSNVLAGFVLPDGQLLAITGFYPNYKVDPPEYGMLYPMCGKTLTVPFDPLSFEANGLQYEDVKIPYNIHSILCDQNSCRSFTSLGYDRVVPPKDTVFWRGYLQNGVFTKWEALDISGSVLASFEFDDNLLGHISPPVWALMPEQSLMCTASTYNGLPNCFVYDFDADGGVVYIGCNSPRMVHFPVAVPVYADTVNDIYLFRLRSTHCNIFNPDNCDFYNFTTKGLRCFSTAVGYGWAETLRDIVTDLYVLVHGSHKIYAAYTGIASAIWDLPIPYFPFIADYRFYFSNDHLFIVCQSSHTSYWFSNSDYDYFIPGDGSYKLQFPAFYTAQMGNHALNYAQSTFLWTTLGSSFSHGLNDVLDLPYVCAVDSDGFNLPLQFFCPKGIPHFRTDIETWLSIVQTYVHSNAEVATFVSSGCFAFSNHSGTPESRYDDIREVATFAYTLKTPTAPFGASNEFEWLGPVGLRNPWTYSVFCIQSRVWVSDDGYLCLLELRYEMPSLSYSGCTANDDIPEEYWLESSGFRDEVSHCTALTVLNDILNESCYYEMSRPVTLWLMAFDPTDGTLVHEEQIASGTIYEMRHLLIQRDRTQVSDGGPMYWDEAPTPGGFELRFSGDIKVFPLIFPRPYQCWRTSGGCYEDTHVLHPIGWDSAFLPIEVLRTPTYSSNPFTDGDYVAITVNAANAYFHYNNTYSNDGDNPQHRHEYAWAEAKRTFKMSLEVKYGGTLYEETLIDISNDTFKFTHTFDQEIVWNPSTWVALSNDVNLSSSATGNSTAHNVFPSLIWLTPHTSDVVAFEVVLHEYVHHLRSVAVAAAVMGFSVIEPLWAPDYPTENKVIKTCPLGVSDTYNYARLPTWVAALATGNFDSRMNNGITFDSSRYPATESNIPLHFWRVMRKRFILVDGQIYATNSAGAWVSAESSQDGDWVVEGEMQGYPRLLFASFDDYHAEEYCPRLSGCSSREFDMYLCGSYEQLSSVSPFTGAQDYDTYEVCDWLVPNTYYEDLYPCPGVREEWPKKPPGLMAPTNHFATPPVSVSLDGRYRLVYFTNPDEWVLYDTVYQTLIPLDIDVLGGAEPDSVVIIPGQHPPFISSPLVAGSPCRYPLLHISGANKLGRCVAAFRGKYDAGSDPLWGFPTVSLATYPFCSKDLLHPEE